MKTNSDILVSKHHQTNSSLNYSAITTEGKQKKKKRNINSYKDIYLQKQSSSPNQSLQFKTHTANLTLNSQNDNSDSKGHNKSFRVNSQQNKRQDIHNLSIPNYSRSNTATPNMMKKGRKDNKNESDDLLGEEISKVNNAKDLFVNKGRKGNIKKGFRESKVKEFKIGEDISEIRSDSYRKDTLEVEKERKDKEKVNVKGDLNGNDDDVKKNDKIKTEVMMKEKVDLSLKGINDIEHSKNHTNVNSNDNKSDINDIKDNNTNIKNVNTALKTKNNIDKHSNINNNNTSTNNDNTLINNNNNNNTSIINKNTNEQPKQKNIHNNNNNDDNNTQKQPHLHSQFIKSNSNIPTITEEPNSKNESYEEISLYEETEIENIDSKGNKTKSKQLIKTKKQIPKSQINSILQQQSLLKQKHSNNFTTPPHNEPIIKPEITSTTLSNTLSPLTTHQLKQNNNIQETPTNPTSPLPKYEYEQKQIPIYDNNGNIIGYTIKKYRKRKQSNNNDIEIIEEIEEGSNGEIKVINVIQRTIIKDGECDNNNNNNTNNNIQKAISSSPTQTHIKHNKRTFHYKTPSESQILYKSPNIHLQYTPSIIKPSASVRLYSPIQQYKIVHENEMSTYSQPKIKSPLILSIIQNHFSINTTNTSNTNNKHHQRALTEGNIIPNISKHTSLKQKDKSSTTTTTQIHNLINDIHSKTNSNNKESSSYLEQLSKQHKSELKQLQTKRDNIKKEKRQRNEYKRTYHHNKNISCISIGTNNSLEKRLPQLLNDNIYQKELITSNNNNTSINEMKLHSNQYHYKLTAPSRCIKGDNLYQQRSQLLNKRKEGYANIATLRYNNKFLTERKKVSFCDESKDRFPHINNNNNEYKTPYLSKLKADNLKYEIEKHIKLSCRNNPYEISKQTTHQRNVFSQEHIEPKSSFKNSYGIMPINSMNELYEMQYHYYFFKK